MLGLILTLVVVGILLYVLNTYVPMDATILRIINIVVILLCVLYVLDAFGVFRAIHDRPVPHVPR